MKQFVINMLYKIGERLFGTEPDWGQMIKDRVALIETNIEKATTFQHLKTCEAAVILLLSEPFPKETHREAGALRSKIGWKAFELRMQAADNILKPKNK